MKAVPIGYPQDVVRSKLKYHRVQAAGITCRPRRGFLLLLTIIFTEVDCFKNFGVQESR